MKKVLSIILCILAALFCAYMEYLTKFEPRLHSQSSASPGATFYPGIYDNPVITDNEMREVLESMMIPENVEDYVIADILRDPHYSADRQRDTLEEFVDAFPEEQNAGGRKGAP